MSVVILDFPAGRCPYDDCTYDGIQHQHAIPDAEVAAPQPDHQHPPCDPDNCYIDTALRASLAPTGDAPTPDAPDGVGRFVEAEARRLAGGAHVHGAIPARFWRDAIDAQAHDHDPASCDSCHEERSLRFGDAPTPDAPDWDGGWRNEPEAGDAPTPDAHQMFTEAEAPTRSVRLAEEWLAQTTDGGPSIVSLNVRAFAVWLDLHRQPTGDAPTPATLADCPSGCGHSWWAIGDDSYGCTAPAPASGSDALREAERDLTAAWRDVEAALPKSKGAWGYSIHALKYGSHGWRAVAAGARTGEWVEGFGATPVAALDALRAALGDES